MDKFKVAIGLVILFLLSHGILYAEIITVDDDGANFDTIQAAIDAANYDDTILIYPGIYVEDINLHKENLTLISFEGRTNTRIIGNVTVPSSATK